MHRENGIQGEQAREMLMTFIKERQETHWKWVKAEDDEPESPIPSGIRSVVVITNNPARQPRPRKDKKLPSPVPLEEPDDILLEEPPRKVRKKTTESVQSILQELECSPSSSDISSVSEMESIQLYKDNTIAEAKKDKLKHKKKETEEKNENNKNEVNEKDKEIVIEKDNDTEKEHEKMIDKEKDTDQRNDKDKQKETDVDKETVTEKENSRKEGAVKEKKSSRKEELEKREEKENNNETEGTENDDSNVTEKQRTEERTDKSKNSVHEKEIDVNRETEIGEKCDDEKKKTITIEEYGRRKEKSNNEIRKETNEDIEGKAINRKTKSDNINQVSETATVLLDQLMNNITETFRHPPCLSPLKKTTPPPCSPPPFTPPLDEETLYAVSSISNDPVEVAYERSLEIISQCGIEFVQELVIEEEVEKTITNEAEEQI